MEDNMTAANLRSAHGGESMAYMRYRTWGEHAKKEGFANVSRLFEAIAYAERVHATNHFQELGQVTGDFLVAAMAGFGLSETSENLEGAISGENFEIEQMYPAFIAVANMQKEKGAERSMTWAWEAEKVHSQLFTAAKASVDQGADFHAEHIHICGVCGFTTTEDAPDVCPICGAKRERFVAF